MIVIDLETTGLSPILHKIHGIGLAQDEDETSYQPTHSGLSGMILPKFNQDILGHNLRFDLKFLGKAGFRWQGKIYCTMILAQLIDENQPLNLKDLSVKHLGYWSLESKRRLDQLISKEGFRTIDQLCQNDLLYPKPYVTEAIGKYCQEDCNNTLRLWWELQKAMRIIHKQMKSWGFSKTPADYYVEEAMPLEEVLLDMELLGIRVRRDRIDKFREEMSVECDKIKTALRHEYAKEIKEIEDVLYDKAVAKRKSEVGKRRVPRRSKKYATIFNWNSNMHMGSLLYVKLGIPKRMHKRTKSGQFDVSEEQLRRLWRALPPGSRSRNFLEMYARYKKRQKLLNTYTGEEKGLVSHIIGDRVYADYVQAGGPVTGRLASRKPNMQNLPRDYPDVKRFFVPDDDEVFAYFDYSQIELRVAAHLSKDPQMIAAYTQEDGDIHQQTADAAGVERQKAKTINFAMIYGASAFRLRGEFQDKFRLDQCESFRQAFFKLYKGYGEYFKQQERLLQQRGFVVSLFGRVRRLPELKTEPENSKAFKHALKQGINFPIQSAAASICKRAMIALHKAGFKVVTQVHDSVVVALKTTEIGKLNQIQEIAENVCTLAVPLKAEVKLLNSLDEEDTYEQSINCSTG